MACALTREVAGQVGRRGDPAEDAAALLAIRRAVGADVALRADANQKWSLPQALAFGRAAQAAGLQVRTCHAYCVVSIAAWQRSAALL